MLLHFSLLGKLKTKKIVFEDKYNALDPATLEQLKELTSRRKAIEESINQSSTISEAVAREMSGGLTSPLQQDLYKMEQYLPSLAHLVIHVESKGNSYKIARLTASLEICWTSALRSSSLSMLRGPKYFQIRNLRFEYGMILFLYGATLQGRALEVLTADSDFARSASLLREAAGIFHHLAHEVLPPLKSLLPLEVPPEVLSSVSSVMSFVCLAEAQAVAVTKAEMNGASPNLLAKLHYGVAQFLEEAISAFHTAKAECSNISSKLSEFIFCSKCLHQFKSQKYFAETQKDTGNFGVTIGILHSALADVKGIVPKKESWKSVFLKEINDVSQMLKKLEHENDFIWRQRVSSNDVLPSPEGKKIVSIISYAPRRCEQEIRLRM